MTEPVVLLQTDLVDSMQLADRLGDAAMAAVWTEHNRIARYLLRAWHGQEIDRSDGFLMRFDSVAAAAGYALECHRALAAMHEPLRMRAGIHVGPVRIHENAAEDVARGAKPFDVGGLSIPITSRIMSLAGAGQTLMSADARRALGASMRRVHSHGHWRLKGIEEPFELFEVGDQASPFVPPADAAKAYCVIRRGDLWVPRHEVRHSLPAERNAFIGRSEPLARLTERLQDGARLISILGPGGTGKTRIAQRFGWKWLGDFEGGVWFCDLSQATTRDGLISAVAQGLEVPLGTTPPIEQLAEAIAGRGACLVILDNFEQIMQYARETLGRWLDRAHQARFIVTTRTVLNLDGEEVLSLPQMSRHEGAALFVQRAKASRRDFDLADGEAPRLDSLIGLLDGLPLAIELAAARVRIMSIDALADRMKERFSLLATNAGRTDRHATLRATLDWSWDLLSPAEKTALAQAAVFEGGFGMAAFERVVDLAAVPGAPEAIDVLQSLVDKSWVQQSSASRFGLLQSVQEYAAERLALDGGVPGSGAQATLEAQRRHWRFHAQRSQQQATAGGWIDLDNFVQACRRATACGEATSAASALENTWRVLKLCGPYEAIVPLAQGVRAMPDLAADGGALVEFVLGSALLMLGRVAEAERCLRLGLSRAEEAGLPHHLALLLCQLGEMEIAAGRNADAQCHLDRALALCDAHADSALHCAVLNALGNLHHNAGDLEQARLRYARALEMARQRNDLRWEGGLLGNLGLMNHGLGRSAEARDDYEQALALVRRTGERRWEANIRCNLGLLCSDLGQAGEAREHLQQALSSARLLGHRKLEYTVLCNLGIVAEGQRQLDQARAEYRAAIDIAVATDDRRSQGQACGYLGLLEGRAGHAQASHDALAKAVSLLTESDDQWNLGLLHCGAVEVALGCDRIDAARDAVQRAEAAWIASGTPRESPLRIAIDRVAGLVREHRTGDAMTSARAG